MASRAEKILLLAIQASKSGSFIVSKDTGILTPALIECDLGEPHNLNSNNYEIYPSEHVLLGLDLNKTEVPVQLDNITKNPDEGNSSGKTNLPIPEDEIFEGSRYYDGIVDIIEAEEVLPVPDQAANIDEVVTSENLLLLDVNNTEVPVELNNITGISDEDDSDKTYVPVPENENSDYPESDDDFEPHEDAVGVVGDQTANIERTENILNIKVRNKRKMPSGWKNNENKEKRLKGLPYMGKKKNEEDWDYNIQKPGKFLANPCNCTLSKKKCVILCQKMTAENRLKIFQHFWNDLNWGQRQVQVQTLVKSENVKRRRGGKNNISKRNLSIKYFLKVGLETTRVCKRMFLGTLGLKETMVLNYIKNGKLFPREENHIVADGATISRKSEVRKINFQGKNGAVYKFLQSLPKLESHYCRSSTKKMYLEPMWHTKAELYRFFKNKYCVEEKLECSSIFTFCKIFEELNISLYTPKKDLCDVCEAYKTQNLSEEKYLEHQTLKQEARKEKEKDKSATDLKVNVYAMDLQSVLLSPKSNVSAMYYKTKLIVHNFTLYNLKSHEGFCFLWNESEGSITSNEFSSILSYFVESQIASQNDLQELIFYSDGCTGQNRNSTLSNAFLNLCITHNIKITQKYLCKGHTQMEVDSMHSTIERQIRACKINLPADYVYHCIKARQNPAPYEVKYLNHTFFKKFDGLKFYNSIRPGRAVGDPVVTDIKALQYLSNGEIFFKLRHTHGFSKLDSRVIKKIIPCKFNDLPPLYVQRRKIKKEKYNHLQILKAGLLEDYHKFYDELPYE